LLLRHVRGVDLTRPRAHWPTPVRRPKWANGSSELR